MSAKIYNYFVTSNSSRNNVNYFDENVKDLEKLYILKGCSDSLKSSLMKNLGIDCFIKGYDIEYIHSSADESFVEAVLIPALHIGIANGSAQYISESNACNQKGEIIFLETDEETRSLLFKKDPISVLNKKIKKYYKKAYKLFNKALKMHNKLEKFHPENISFKELCEIADKTLKNYLSYQALKKEGIIRDRMSGEVTHKGFVNFVTGLTADIGKRYFVKGPSSSGKSVLLQRIADTARERGFDVEVYHNCFDPQRLDMIIVRELDLAVFDSTEPNEYYPSRSSDEVIDLFGGGIALDTAKYSNKLEKIKKHYDKAVNKGTSFLKKAKKAFDDMEDEFKETADLKKIGHLWKCF
ncbi:MAG: hypothetical protein K0R50_3473 [Eubacterium sp.]|nr:hypothetical protein [Eubacterium sp.]